LPTAPADKRPGYNESVPSHIAGLRHGAIPTTRPALRDLGLLGDTRTAALVDARGRIVWLCLPHFDGEPVFGTLVAGEGGGVFALGPSGDAEVVHRRYRRGSTVPEATWAGGGPP